MSKPIGNVVVAIGHNDQRWGEETFETSLTYEECKDEMLLLDEAGKVMNLGDDVAFIHMTHYEDIMPDRAEHKLNNQALSTLKIENVLKFYKELVNSDFGIETDLRDLLIDLMHFCDAEEYGFEDYLDMARNMYRLEQKADAAGFTYDQETAEALITALKGDANG